MLGGFKIANTPNQIIAEIAESFKSEMQTKLNIVFNIFEVIDYKKQIVAGTNYSINIKIDEGKTITAVIYEPLPCHNKPRELTSVNEND